MRTYVVPLSNAQDIEQTAAAFHAKHAGSLPKGLGWDWMPFFTALCEGNIIAYGATVIHSPDRDDSDSMDTSGSTPRYAPTPIDRVAIEGPGVPKAPGSGSWQYSWYIPEWTHPDYDPSIDPKYLSPSATFASTDPFNRLRPALRAEDLVRQPTQWALRFGIHRDELGGRSRLSPTLADSRNPFDDYANQVNLLSDEVRAGVVQASKEAAMRQGFVPAEGYIAPDILEGLLETDGRLSGRQLKEKLSQALGSGGDDLNLDQFVEAMNQEAPTIFEAHRTFLQNALDDQDYQRALFHDLTSDDLVKEGIYTMSNNEICDLDNPVNDLFDRHRWGTSAWKGATKDSPRFVYNLNGVRDEWDVTTNELLWNALRPALQLVSRVLESEPPGIVALMDLTTRQPIPPERDQREKRETAYLTAYYQNADLSKTYEQIRQLHEMGYDFKMHTLRVLKHCLRLDISSVWFDPKDPNGKPADSPSLTYAYTVIREAGPDSGIEIWIGAELLWPLLVPQYSFSEKMTASFVIASSLLHELGHAICYAQRLLLDVPEFTNYPNQDPRVTQLLGELPDLLFDFAASAGEPFWMDQGTAEAGYDVEYSLWGFVALNMLNHEQVFSSRQLMSLPLIVGGTPWPFTRPPLESGLEYAGPVADAPFRVEDYIVPVPVEYMAKFFTKAFWEETFPRWGHEAFKMLPPDRILKTVSRPVWIARWQAMWFFGGDEWRFLYFVMRTLSRNRYLILGEYLRQSAIEVMMSDFYHTRWEEEVKLWDSGTLSPLRRSFFVTRAMIQHGYALSRSYLCSGVQKRTLYKKYVEKNETELRHGRPNDPTATFEDWAAGVERNFRELYSDGGSLMRILSETHRFLMLDIAYMQRMVFDYLTLNFQTREVSYAGSGRDDRGPFGKAVRRMDENIKFCIEFGKALNEICNAPVFTAERDLWMAWAARYRACESMYKDLLQMLDQRDDLDPADNSWKKHLATVPSSYWKSRMHRLRVLAQKEYVRLDPRIRSVFDQCEAIIRRVNGTMERGTELPPEFAAGFGNIAGLRRGVGTGFGLGQPLPENIQRGPFNWTAPADLPTGLPIDGPTGLLTDLPPVQPAPFATNAPAATAPSNVTNTGEAGARWPRRDGAADTPPGLGSNSRPVLGSHLEQILETGRVRDGAPEPVGSGFARFNQGSSGEGFMQAAQQAAAQGNLENSGYLESANAASGLSAFGSGGPFSTETPGDTIFNGPNVSELGRAPTMFPEPYAGPTIMTSDVLFGELMRVIDTYGRDGEAGAADAQTPYQATGPWRERAPSTDSNVSNPDAGPDLSGAGPYPPAYSDFPQFIGSNQNNG